MAAVVERTCNVNELTPDPDVAFDRKIAETYLDQERWLKLIRHRNLKMD